MRTRLKELLEALRGEHADYVRVSGEHAAKCSVCALIDDTRHRLETWDTTTKDA